MPAGNRVNGSADFSTGSASHTTVSTGHVYGGSPMVGDSCNNNTKKDTKPRFLNCSIFPTFTNKLLKVFSQSVTQKRESDVSGNAWTTCKHHQIMHFINKKNILNN